jgi:Protein of unknown function (DUF4089)
MVANPDESLDEWIEAAARALLLPIESEWKAAVRANLEVTLKHAAAVEEFPLPDEAEPAPYFRA